MVIISRLQPEVIRICRPLIVEDQVLKLCAKKFTDYLEKSLSAEFAHNSTVKATETHILDVPTGNEIGNAIGVNFCGKVFRIVHAFLRGERVYTIVSSRLYEIPEAKLRGSGFKMVEYVARCIANFIETSSIKQEKIAVGLSVGFPMQQDSLQNATILAWNEDFNCDDFIKEDFFVQLKLALKKFTSSKNVYLISVTNQSGASLLAGLFKDPTVRVGLVVGNRIEVTYLEKQDNVTLFPGDGFHSHAALGLDFRSFGDDGCLDFIKTEFDYQVDSNSFQPGHYTLEKLISGQYLGELLRLAAVRLIKEQLILNGVVKPKLRSPGAFKTEDICIMESEEENSFKQCKAILCKLGYSEPSDDDCCQLRFVARCIAKRSANLLAAFLSAILAHLQMKEVHICADGQLFLNYRDFASYVTKKMNKLKRPEIKYTFSLNDKEDTSLGAALLAYTYKDGVIKIEDKYRVLPPFKGSNLEAVPPGAECKECEGRAQRPFQQICQ